MPNALYHNNDHAGPPRSDLMSRDEAATYLRVRPQTLAAWATTRRYGLRMVKVGARVFYRRRDLDAFLDARTIGDEAP